MNELVLKLIASNEEKETFTREFQESFQHSNEAEFGESDKPIISAEEVQESFDADGAESFVAEINGQHIGGVVVINPATGRNLLDLLYVKPGTQNSGNGLKIWQALEKLHLEAKVWEALAPYFDKRNIHFYVNRCGFKIVEFYYLMHRDPNRPGGLGDGLFFRFEKEMS